MSRKRYVQLLINGRIVPLDEIPPPMFIYSPPSQPIAQLDPCSLDERLSAFSAQYNLTNNTFSICGAFSSQRCARYSNVFYVRSCVSPSVVHALPLEVLPF
jgi:hypothetical protein